jgi:hypothetical protein
MGNSAAEGASAFGFLTVRYHYQLGFFGGLLTVNALGRPKEFHCTLPLRPNRAQEILYGASLIDFICGEQIGLALAKRAKVAPSLLLTDSRSVLGLRRVHSTPLVLSEGSLSGDDAAAASSRIELVLPESQLPDDQLASGHLAGRPILVLGEHAADAERAIQLWEELRPQIDLEEPFSRIVEALCEAHPSARAA